MKIDQKSLERLLKLNDDQLRRVLAGLIAEYGIDPSAIPLDGFDMGRLRAVLSTATEEDLQGFLNAMPHGKGE